MIKTDRLAKAKTAAKAGSGARLAVPKWAKDLPLHLLLIIILVVILFPFAWMVGTSLKPASDATPSALNGSDHSFGVFLGLFWPREFHFENYADAWTNRYGPTATPHTFFDAPFFEYFRNSIIVGVAETLGVVVTSTMAAFAFARLEFWGKNILFAFILTTLAIPHEANYLPNVVIITGLGLSGTIVALFLPWLASAFYIFLIRQFFMSLPQDLYEAGELDGLTDLGYLWRIAIPLSMPAVLTVALFAFLGNWNALLWPLIAAPNWPVVQVGLSNFIANGDTQQQWDLLMAAATIVILPIIVIYFLVQRRFIEGIARTGIK